MPFLDSTAKGIRPFLQIFLLCLLLIAFQCVSAEKGPYKDCSQDMLLNSTRCIDPGTYYAKINEDICRITVNSIHEDCPQEELTRRMKSAVEKDDDGQSGPETSSAFRQVNCGIPKNYANITRDSSWAQGCYSYYISACAAGSRVLNIYTEGGDFGLPGFCYAVHINGRKTESYVIRLDPACGRNVVTLYLDVNKHLTVLTATSPTRDSFRLNENKEFQLSICFDKCLGGRISVTNVTMFDFWNGPGECDEGHSDCMHYNGPIPSKCWQRGCQYSKDDDKCITGKHLCEAKINSICSHKFCENFYDTSDCSLEPRIFNNKLSCRRADTYYAYHPKILRFNDLEIGNCAATSTYAVNLGGGKAIHVEDIDYSADWRFRDPHNTRSITRCPKVDGVRGTGLTNLYANTYVGDKSKYDSNRDGACIYYSIPICQNGEYMLTLKMVEPQHTMANSRCTEARINDVPIMIHMDTFTLAKNKTCGAVDVALMFLAAGGSETNPKSNYTLHLAGHFHPIQVTAGKMILQFCIGYECSGDPHPCVSSFSLERWGKVRMSARRKTPTSMGNLQISLAHRNGCESDNMFEIDSFSFYKYYQKT